MKVLFAILRALWTVVRRDLTGFGPVRTNNFFLFVALLIWGNLVSGLAPVSAYPFLVLLAALLFFPISSDPLEKIPRVRMGLWPVAARDRVALRIVALAFSPVLWVTVALLIREGRSVVIPLAAVTGAAVVRALVTTRAPRFAVGRIVPAMSGSTGILLAGHLRGMLAVLDTWLALAIAIFATVAEPAAATVLSMLVGIALSTQAQCGADLDATRLRLLPWPAWRVLLARDAAYLALQLLLTLPLDPMAGLAFGMTALAMGRYPSLHANLHIDRWRFASGRVLFGAIQMIAGAMLAFAGAKGTAAAAILWAGSLYWGGSVLDRRLHGIRRERP